MDKIKEVCMLFSSLKHSHTNQLPPEENWQNMSFFKLCHWTLEFRVSEQCFMDYRIIQMSMSPIMSANIDAEYFTFGMKPVNNTGVSVLRLILTSPLMLKG